MFTTGDGTTLGITEAYTVLGTMEVSITLGTMQDITTLGTMEAGAGITGTAIIITRTTAAGTEAGILIMDTDTYMVRDISMTSRADPDTTCISEARDTRQDQTECSQAGHRSEEVPA